MTAKLKVKSPFYRGTIKALIFDDANRLLVTQCDDDSWELPGGGWEHDESFEDCVRRELEEELGVRPAVIGDIKFVYRGVNYRGWITLRLVVPVTLESTDFKSGDNMVATRYVSREELMGLYMLPDEATVKDCADQIWSTVDK